MKKLKLFILLAPLFFHCESEKNDELTWYTDVNPDQSTTTMVPFPWVIETLSQNSITSAAPTGNNSIVSFATALRGYDLDGDSFHDFSFFLSHYFRDNGLIYELLSIGLSKDHSVSLSDATKYFVKGYSYGDVLDYESFGTNQQALAGYLVKIDDTDNLATDGEFYIAVKKIINNRPHYGWFLIHVESASLTVTVKEFALCRNAGQEITIGQR